MPGESTARDAVRTSVTLNTPEATPSAIRSRTTWPARRRSPATTRKSSSGRAVGSYWTTRATVWRSACQAMNSSTSVRIRSTGSEPRETASSIISSVSSCPGG